jgi:tRNA pseudouridine55 synthase
MKEESNPGEVILMNKPVGWSSFQVVKKVKFMLRVKKVGHAGTLDPLASGLLILCTEKQTKIIDQIQSAEKEYTGTIVLGATTPSYDMETEINEHFPTNHISMDLIQSILPQFIGEISQAPPLFSAIKVDGKRAYSLARTGVEHKMKERLITIKELEITSLDLPEVHFRVVCTKGTYIRSLAFDIGKALKSGGYLKDLVRTRIGEYSLKDAFTPSELQKIRKPDNDVEKTNVLPEIDQENN